MRINKIVMSLAISAAITGTGHAADQSESMFTLFDINKNNQLTLQEFRDGGLDSEGVEWAKGLSTVCTENTLKQIEPVLVKQFKVLDKDNSGTISRAEFTKQGDRVYNEYWQASFKTADGDNNSKLSSGEYVKQYTDYIATLKEAYAGNKIPTECKADVEYWSEYYKGLNQYAAVSFQYLDANSDQTLDLPEYKGTHLWK